MGQLVFFRFCEKNGTDRVQSKGSRNATTGRGEKERGGKTVRPYDERQTISFQEGRANACGGGKKKGVRAAQFGGPRKKESR